MYFHHDDSFMSKIKQESFYKLKHALFKYNNTWLYDVILIKQQRCAASLIV